MIRSILVAEPNKTLESSKIVGLRVAPPNLRKRFVSQASNLLRSPWLPYAVVQQLRKTIKPGFKVFEYGAGGSTVFFLEQGCQVVSVEHHETWFERVSEHVSEQNFQHWQGFLCLPEPLSSDPEASYRSRHRDYRSASFKKYVCAIDQFADQSFDVILIDGRARNACFQAALKKLKPDGLLLWDNVERQQYKLKELLGDEKFVIKTIGGATPGINFFTWTAFVSRQHVV
jgi:hypothetical protein